MLKPSLSIIVISYNTREMTLGCLRSILSETKQTDYELIVLDNASEDGSADAIESEFKGLARLIRSEKNLGFAAGNNIAAKSARGERFLLLNPDTLVLDGAVDRLCAFAAEHPERGIWGGRTVFADGKLNPASCWRQQTLWSLFCLASGLTSLFRNSPLFNYEGIGGWDRSGERDVEIVTGCFFLVDRAIWRLLDGFQEKYFMYGEEADFCLRARRQGVRPLVSSAATIVHYGGASEKLRADKLVRLIRAKMLLIHDHFSPLARLPGYLLLAMWPLSRCLAHLFTGVIGLASYEGYRTWRSALERWRQWAP